MILEEATKEAYGYEVWGLKPQSDKHILAACDDCDTIRRTSKHSYRSLCRSCIKKGKGRIFTEEHKAKISAALKGKNNPMFGRTGTQNPAWQGGVSFEPYCAKFNEAFKEYIRAKFDFKCFLCPTTQAENCKKLCVHHINYNKQCGCDGDKTCNFVPLCVACHNKTNFNREYWLKSIMNKLHCLIIGWDV